MSIYSVLLKQNQFVHRDDLTYPYEERGLQFGDGIYEVIRIYNGHYYLLEEHVSRLFRSAEAIKIKIPFTMDEITDLLSELLVRNHTNANAKVYMQITRGSAPRDHAFPKYTGPNMYAYIDHLPRNLDSLEKGVSTITVPDIRWEYCYIKSLNLLPNVLAKQEAKENNCYEAIFHKDGIVTEGSSTNVYMVKDGAIYTYPATKRILHGCVRMRVEEFAENLQIPFIEEGFSVENAIKADELFLSSSTAEITPVVRIDGHVIDSGKPGSVTRKLQTAYEQDANIK